MKTPPLDILLRYIPQVVVPPEDLANTDDSEVVVNQQSLVIPPPASTSRTLSYPPLHLDHHNHHYDKLLASMC